MAQAQYLTEEHYNKVNKKFKMISLVILILGLVVGGVLIVIGAVKSAEAERINEERRAVATAEYEANIATAKSRIDEIKTKKASLESKKEAKEQECDSMDMRSSDWFAKSSQCNREASAIQSELNDLEVEQFRLENANYSVRYELEQPGTYAIFYVIGASVIIICAMTSLIMYLVTKRRALKAYAIQSTMPVNKEAVEQYTPTVAKAASDVAGSVAEGIARGIKNGKES